MRIKNTFSSLVLPLVFVMPLMSTPVSSAGSVELGSIQGKNFVFEQNMTAQKMFLSWFASQQQAFYTKGFLEVQLNHDLTGRPGNTIDVLWKNISEQDKNAIQQQADQLNVPITFSNSPFSFPEYRTAADRVFAERARWKEKGITVQSVRILKSGDDIFMEISLHSAATKQVLSEAEMSLENTAQIPVRFHYSRFADNRLDNHLSGFFAHLTQLFNLGSLSSSN